MLVATESPGALLEPGQGSGEVDEIARELRFVGVVQDGAEVRAWCVTAFDEVAPQQQSGWGGFMHGHFAGFVANGAQAFRERLRLGRTAEGVGGHNGQESFDVFRFEAFGEAADGAGGGLLEIGHVVEDEWQDARPNGVGRIDAFQEGIGERAAGRLVSRRDDADPAVLEFLGGGDGLAEIMREHPEAVDNAGVVGGFEPGGKGHQRIEAVAGVDEHIAFRVPLRILRHATHLINLRIMLQPLAVGEESEAEGGLHAFGSPLEPFLADAFARQFGVRLLDRARERDGFGSDGQAEAGGELHSTQHTQRVLGKGGTGVAEHLLAQVVFAVEEVEQFPAMRIPHERIDREVAAGSGVAWLDAGFQGDFETLVARGGFRIAAGDGEVVDSAVGHGELGHPERFADEVDTAPRTERFDEILVADAKNFDVEIVARFAEEPVTDAAADEVGVAKPFIAS